MTLYTSPVQLYNNIVQLNQQNTWNPWLLSVSQPQYTKGGEEGLPGSFLEWQSTISTKQGRITNIKTDYQHVMQRLETGDSKIRVALLEHFLESDSNPNITHWTWKYEENVPFFLSPITMFKQLFSPSEEMDLRKTMSLVKETLESK
ncbi:SRPBCC family protein [Membranihabitans marinus]|uniref:hypothetical protein n=1 Tax=Membranihabitans marinus TaxID=1227546 RepID=UPI001F4777BF|nr:hypothetical protein [Membranihabitans marinus]